MAIDSPAPAEPRNGLQTAINIIVSPREAFETLRISPMWGWAFIITVVLALIGAFLAYPAQMHAMHAYLTHMYATDPRMAQLSEEQKARAMALSEGLGKFGFIFLPIVTLLIAAVISVVFLIFNAIAHGDGTFKKFWAATMNTAIVAFGLQQLVSGILAVIRGANAYNSPLDQLLAIPSLAWLAPSAAPKMVAFLSAFNPFTIWAFVLNVLLLTIVARLGKGPAYIAAALVLIIGALFATMAAR